MIDATTGPGHSNHISNVILGGPAKPRRAGLKTVSFLSMARCRSAARKPIPLRAYENNHASSRDPARRSQPRTVAAGIPRLAPIRRCPAPSARAVNAAQIRSAA